MRVCKIQEHVPEYIRRYLSALYLLRMIPIELPVRDRTEIRRKGKRAKAESWKVGNDERDGSMDLEIKTGRKAVSKDRCEVYYLP